ncbi:unnamed protein product [Thelazia callipaeda]|uniref:Shugoshin C-terminal domain-containing protein n=1 Tax=Thelazia callipaeda TaxID=103827 RepID=A0A0N5CSY1_THECL|nr:unnamed protein product [Thelazia callipaeda]
MYDNCFLNQQVVKKQSEKERERTLAETIDEIDKRITVLKKMKSVMGPSEHKQLDSKFVVNNSLSSISAVFYESCKLVVELSRAGQADNAKRIEQIKRLAQTQEEVTREERTVVDRVVPFKSRQLVDVTQHSDQDSKNKAVSQTQTKSSRLASNTAIKKKSRRSRLLGAVPKLSEMGRRLSQQSASTSTYASRKSLHVAETQSTSSKRKAQSNIRNLLKSPMEAGVQFRHSSRKPKSQRQFREKEQIKRRKS